MLLKSFISSAVKSLGKLYPEAEARSLVIMLCQERLGVMSWTHIVEPGTAIPDEELPGLQDDLARLVSGEPIQYILGCTEFRGRIFNIDRRALIPRIETELLVEEVVSRFGEGAVGGATPDIRYRHAPGQLKKLRQEFFPDGASVFLRA